MLAYSIRNSLLTTIYAFSLVACTDNKGFRQRIASTYSAPFIQKGSVLFHGGESTPIVFQGSLYYFITSDSPQGGSIEIKRASDLQTIHSSFTGLAFTAAIEYNGEVYLFGVNQQRTQFKMIHTADLQSWSQPIVVMDAPSGHTIYNNSVAPDPTTGGFIMAYELSGTKTGGFFATSFMRSQDLLQWESVQEYFGIGIYTACPTIRYSNGYYYLFYLSEFLNGTEKYWATLISRSPDLKNWRQAYQSVLTPFDGDDAQLRNTSDMDLVEFNGQVIILYTNTAQDGSVADRPAAIGYKDATFNGTMDDFLVNFF